MALWQFDLHLIPAASTVPDARKANREFPFGPAWTFHDDPDDVVDAVCELRPTEHQDWTNDIKRVGNSDGSYASLVLADGVLVELEVRFHLGEPVCFFVPFLNGVVRIAVDQDLVFTAPSGECFVPSVSTVLEHAAASEALRYCQDPKAFMSGS